MKVVIVLGTYNGGNYIEKQIESFFQQTVLPNELLIADDGSQDNTIEVIERLQQHSPFPISLLQNETNIGYTKNFEQLLSRANADIIFFSDQDDWWCSDKIKKVVAVFEKSPSTMVVINDMILADGNLNPTNFTQLKNIRNIGMSDDSFVAGCAVAMRGRWKKVVLPFPEDYEGHDNWINRLAIITDCRQVIETPLQWYRRHASNVSQSFASQPKKVSRVNAVLSHGLKSAEEGWIKELRRIKLTEHRLLEKQHFFAEENRTAVYYNALKESKRKVVVYENRIVNTGKSKLKRIIPLFTMLVKGDYRFFSGYKSFIKDIIR